MTGNSNSGAGAGGYPAAGIGRWSELGRWPEETTLVQLVGYTAGYGEGGLVAGKNGNGTRDVTNSSSSGIGAGGGYYSFFESYSRAPYDSYIGYFGLGGCWYGDEYGFGGSWSTAGSGGTAGQGGTIEYSPTSEINSYNGNMITEDDFNYSNTYYEYDEDGNYLDGTDGKDTKVANVVEFKNDSSKKIIPAKIFIQDGIKRDVYDNLCYMSEERKKQYGVDGVIPMEKIKNTSKNGAVQCVRIVDKELNVTHSRQGIGSGAGYIEVSNGTFNVVD